MVQGKVPGKVPGKVLGMLDKHCLIDAVLLVVLETFLETAYHRFKFNET